MTVTEAPAAGAEREAVAGTVAPAPPPRERLVALDVFRGMTIAGMLLVNDPGTWSAIFVTPAPGLSNDEVRARIAVDVSDRDRHLEPTQHPDGG